MKNKFIILSIFFLLITSITASATVDSIYEYIKKVDDKYYVVVGLEGESGDSFAATDIKSARLVGSMVSDASI